MKLKKLLTGLLCSAMVLGCSFSGIAAETAPITMKSVDISVKEAVPSSGLRPATKGVTPVREVRSPDEVYPKAAVRSVVCEALASDAAGNLYLFPEVSFGINSTTLTRYLGGTIPNSEINYVKEVFNNAGYRLQGWRMTTTLDLNSLTLLPRALHYTFNDNPIDEKIQIMENCTLDIYYDFTIPYDATGTYSAKISGEFICRNLNGSTDTNPFESKLLFQY